MRTGVLILILLLALMGTTTWLFVTTFLAGNRDYEGMSGGEIYEALCISCHGRDGSAPLGLASSYAGKRQFWNAKRLLDYVDDPRAFAKKDPRLGVRYMPPIPRKVPPDARRRLVEHVLSLMD